ncbi:MAG: AarF/ABC1/UbiB kinase family protein [Nitrospirae bacterium]|nr:MAG: AarF/ABC1/UbiB kinase family protein [Nitrospirota bacterium]
MTTALRLPFNQPRVRQLRRLRTIIRVFGKYGFGEFVHRLNLEGLSSFTRRLRHFGRVRPEAEVRRLTGPRRLRRALEELGPTFIKFGQILSTRPDLMPDEYARELARLQDRLPPFPSEAAREVIAEELGRPVEELFRAFVDPPVAAASIAQVHAAELADGSQVVVKVQRPGIQSLVETDIHILLRLAALAQRTIREARHLDLVGLVHQFARTIRQEMDFSLEAANAERMAANFRDQPQVVVPKIHWDYTSRRVLVMERISGVRITDFERYDLVGAERKQVARVCANAYLKMLLEDGCFHADPHPGNLMVLEEGRVAFLDFGQMGNVGSDKDVQEFFDAFIAFVNRDFDRLVDYFIRRGVARGETLEPDFRDRFRRELQDFLEPYYGRSLKQINAGDYINRVLRLAVDLHLKVPAELYLINKVLLSLEGLVRQLDPGFDFIEVAKPYALRRLARSRGPQGWAEAARSCSADYLEAFRHLPVQARAILQKLVDDEVRAEIGIANLDAFTSHIDRASNRLAFALITASLVVGSSFMVRAGGAGEGGISALGVVGFTLAGALGVWLLVSILKGGKL